MDFSEPLSLLDYYLAELDWRFNLLFNQIWEIYNKLGDIKEILEYNPSPRPSDCQGLAKPLGLEGRVQRVRVRVGTSVPLANPYP